MDVTQLIGAFVAAAIMIGIATIILGTATNDCTQLPDYNATAGATQTGWALQCEDNNTSTQNAFGLLVVVLIVMAAVIVLAVVKML